MAPLNQSDGFALARAKQLLFGGTVTIPRLPLIKHQTVAVYTSSTTPVLIVPTFSLPMLGLRGGLGVGK